MERQRERARQAQKKEVISVSSIEAPATTFVGYDSEEIETRVIDVVGIKDKTAVILESSVCYAEMGGQLADHGVIRFCFAKSAATLEQALERLIKL